jgi:hypothetical protein
MTTPNIPHHYGDELPLYVAGHVSPEESADIERHLAECAACRRECDLWRSLPAALASGDSVPSRDLANDEVWSKIAPRLYDTPTMNGRATSMSFTSDIPPRPPSPSRPPRTMRRNTWAAVAVVLVIVVLMGGFFAVLKGRNTSPSVGGKPPTATATATSTPTPEPTATPTPEPTATISTAPPAVNVSGTWTGNGPDYTPGNTNGSTTACYKLVLSQAQGSSIVTGNFTPFFGTPCGSNPNSFLISGSVHGLQFTATTAPGNSSMAALAMPVSPLHPVSSCGLITFMLTYHSPATLTGTISNCLTVNITFTRH